MLDGESGCMNGYVRERVDKDFERERERERDVRKGARKC